MNLTQHLMHFGAHNKKMENPTFHVIAVLWDAPG